VQVTLAVQAALLRAWPQPQTIAMLVASTAGTRDQVYRACRNLAHAGCAEESAGGWLPGPALTAAAEAIRQRTAALLARYLPPETAQ